MFQLIFFILVSNAALVLSSISHIRHASSLKISDSLDDCLFCHQDGKESFSMASKANAETFLRKTVVLDYITALPQMRLGKRKLVVRFDKDHPGLGDRLSTILNSFLIAVLSQRVFLIDWKQPQDLSLFFRIMFPKVLYSHHQDYDADTYHCRSQCRSFNMRPFLGNKSTIVIYGTPLINSHVLRQMSFEFRADPFIRSVHEHLLYLPRGFHLYDTIFQTLFSPRADILNVENSQAAKIDGAYLAIHARIGKGIGEIGGSRFSAQESSQIYEMCFCFLQEANALIRKDSEIKSIYVASDTLEFALAFEAMMKKTKPHLYIISEHTRLGVPKHTKLCRLREDRSCMQVVLDFAFLSKSKYLVASQSSFSNVASLVGHNSKKVIVQYPTCKERVSPGHF